MANKNSNINGGFFNKCQFNSTNSQWFDRVGDNANQVALLLIY